MTKLRIMIKCTSILLLLLIIAPVVNQVIAEPYGNSGESPFLNSSNQQMLSVKTNLDLSNSIPYTSLDSLSFSRFFTEYYYKSYLAVAESESEDLIETEDVQITDEIRHLAVEELEGDPLKIFLFVYNEIGFLPYGWSLQGSEMTLSTRYGNDYDQSSLLIALYRAAGIPARYVQGFVQVPPERIANWVGADDNLMPLWISLGGNMIAYPIYSDDGTLQYYNVIHCWVKAFINGEWVEMDPSFKEYKYYKRMDFTDQANEVLQEMNLSDIPEQTRITEIEPKEFSRATNQLRNAILRKISSLPEDTKFKSVLGGQSIIKVDDYVSPPPLSIDPKVKFESTSLKEDDRYKVAFIFPATDPNSPTGYSQNINYVFNVSTVAIAGKRVTLSFPPASEKDYETINSYDGFSSTPCDEFTVRPVLMADGEPVLAGDPMKPGIGFPYKIIRYYPSWVSNTESRPPEEMERMITSGSYSVISIYLVRMPRNYPIAIQRLRDALQAESVPLDEIMGGILHMRAILYWSLIEKYRMSTALHHDVSDGFGLPDILQSAILVRKNMVDDKEYLEYYTSFYDVSLFTNFLPRKAIHPTEISPETDNSYVKHDPKVVSANFMYSLIAAHLEAYLFYFLYNLPPTGALHLFKLANERRVPIRVLNSKNFNEEIGTLEIDTYTEENLKDLVNSGRIVFIPERSLENQVLRISISTSDNEFLPESYSTFDEFGYLAIDDEGQLLSTTVMTYELFGGFSGIIPRIPAPGDIVTGGISSPGIEAKIYNGLTNLDQQAKKITISGVIQAVDIVYTVVKPVSKFAKAHPLVGLVIDVVQTFVDNSIDLGRYYGHSDDSIPMKVVKTPLVLVGGLAVSLIDTVAVIVAGVVGGIGGVIYSARGGEIRGDPKDEGGKGPLLLPPAAGARVAWIAANGVNEAIDEAWTAKRRKLLDPKVPYDFGLSYHQIEEDFQLPSVDTLSEDNDIYGLLDRKSYQNSHMNLMANALDIKTSFNSLDDEKGLHAWLISSSGLTTGSNLFNEPIIEDMPDVFSKEITDDTITFNVWNPIPNINDDTYKLVLSNQEDRSYTYYVHVELSGGGETRFYEKIELSLSKGEEKYIPIRVVSDPSSSSLQIDIKQPRPAYTVVFNVETPEIYNDLEVILDGTYLTSTWTGAFKVLAFEKGTKHTIQLNPNVINYQNGTQLGLHPSIWEFSERESQTFTYSSSAPDTFSATSTSTLTPSSIPISISRPIDTFVPYFGLLVLALIGVAAMKLYGYRLLKIEDKKPMKGRKFCIECGKPIRTQSKYCTECGQLQE